MSTQVSLVTGTLNRIESLRRLIYSIRQSVGDLSYEIIVVDSNSSDGTGEWLEKQADVVYINNGEPTGSCAAFQLGFTSRSPNSKYVVTLNDDVEVYGDTIVRAYNYLEAHPDVGQVAFGHRYQDRERIDPGKPLVQKALGYTYAQCGMTRRWLGDLVNWCGPEEGYVNYAWDPRLSLAIWQQGYRVVGVEGCSVIDWEAKDDTREAGNAAKVQTGQHPDSIRFYELWRNVLPDPSQWRPSITKSQRLVSKIVNNNCRVLRFKGAMNPKDPMRTACINALAAWGPAKQVNQTAIIKAIGLAAFQHKTIDIVREYQPDFVMMQAQRPNNILPGTIEHMRREFPDTFFFNWDGDTHYPLETFHYQVAYASDLQGLISPSLFPQYLEHGCPNVCYWPIAVENEFMEVERNPDHLPGPDVSFLGALYGIGKFPEAEMRRDAVVAIHKQPDIRIGVFGYGWNKVGIQTTSTLERFDTNPRRYAQAKMALSVSQASDMWGYSSDRLYNISMTGCPPVCQSFAGMEEHGYVDGETCIAWDTIPEMLDKIRYYLKHDSEREAIGAAGREMALSRHTWPHRVRGLLAMLEGMEYIR